MRAPFFVEALPAGISPEYGEYVAAYGECRGCHGPNATGMEGSMFLEPIPNARPVVSVWTVEQFIATMRTGMRPNGVPFNEDMPWQNAAKMSDQELAALHAYLTAPVK